MDLDVKIASSQKWIPEEAADELILKTKKIISPSFILLFSSIHYKKEGLEKIINRFYNHFPKKTQIIGGTVAGFADKTGCFTRGITCLVCQSKEMQINTFYAKNTKQNPLLAAKHISSNLKKINQTKKNKILIDFISGPSIPAIPILNKVNLIKSKIVGELFTFLLPFSSFLGFGVGKEEEILRKIKEEVQDYNIIGGSTTDDGKLFNSYEIINKKILKNSIVALSISTDHDIKLSGLLQLKKTNKEFTITKCSKDKRTIYEIDNKPALEALISKLEISVKSLKSLAELYRTTFYYPLVSSKNPECSTTIGAIYGKNLIVGHNLNSDKLTLLAASGKRFLEVTEALENTSPDELVLIFACETGLETLGRKIYIQKKKIDKYLKNNDYLIVYLGGEHYGEANKEINIRTHSLNILKIKKSIN